MKKQSRLTALLLALCMLMSTLPVSALADGILTLEDYLSAVQRVQQELSEPSIPVEEENAYTLTRTTATETIVRETVTGELSGEGESAFTLPLAGKLELSTAAAADAYQWQIDVGGVWANIVGDTAAAVTLTYAKVQNALSGGTARVRCAMTQDGQTVYSAVAAVTVDETVKTQTVEGTEEISAVSYTSEAPRSLARTLNAGVGTYNAVPLDDTPSTYNVVINYLFENNEIVSDPYTANLAAGSKFSATVTFPTVQGYLPFLNEVQQNSLDLNYTAIDKDYTYNVVYKPTNVNYTVIHNQQNPNDDKYTEAERETKRGLTNSTVPEVAKTYEGFYALLYEKPKIAADGFTVVEVYYDRYYHLMNFDLDGGYGVEPIYARYGAPIGEVGKPTKAGYTFSGWSLNGAEAGLPKTMPAENRTYKAVWKADDTAKVTVVFWGENADDEEYSYIKSAQVNVKPGTEFTYSESGVLTCTQEEHTHSESCYTCGQTEHTTHTTACYQGVGNKQDVYTGVPNNPTEGQVIDHWVYGKLIYIKGSWYRYSGSIAAGQIAPTTCHKHTEACLGCGKTEHTHKPECYMSVAGLDSNLWKFVKSDTVTVAADGSSVVNVYYDRVEYSVQFYSRNNRPAEYTDLKITAKWGQDIHDKWPTYNNSSSWYVNTTDNRWQNSIEVMPVGGAKFYGPKTGSNSSTAYYYVEVLPGESVEITYNGVSYKLHHTDTSSSSGNVTEEDKYEIQGFTFKEGTQNGTNYNNAKFYYTRNKYAIEFFNPTELIKTVKDVPYQSPLGSYDFTPGDEYIPEKYEPGSVKFGGWYLNPQCTGERYDLDKHAMPLGAKNGETALSLYAKWVPVTHTVSFYLDKDALDADTKLSTHSDITVPHGSKADPTPANPTNGNYTFVGWFYMDNDVEKAFDFANMPVNKDLQVYGKWSSNVLKKYTIYYKIQGTDTEIADRTTGSGLAGITKTFEAKGGTELYADYQEGYFPVTKSHSMTIDINATEQNDTNVYTFWYVQKKEVPYIVRYVDEDGKELYTQKVVVDNRKAVVTETFQVISGYLPDEYQKRLVVTGANAADDEWIRVTVDDKEVLVHPSNVITFVYKKDDKHALYTITHYTELGVDSQNNPTWLPYSSSTATGDIGTTYSATPMDIPGFTYDSTVTGTVTSGKLSANGLELKLYYTRNSYPYQVRYLEKDTGKQLADPKNGTGKYGQVISESANEIANYDAVDPTSQTLNIRIETDNVAKLNIITFYYKEKEVTINYQVVGPDGCGTVSPTSETLKVLSGTAKGSTATVTSDEYRFVGWYTDAACTAQNLVSTDEKYVPTQPSHEADGQKVLDPWVAATYYAKFEYNLTTLTVKKTGLNQSTTEDCESAIFTVKDSSGKLVARFALQNNDSAVIDRLTVGNAYTVTEENSWTWRYTSSVSEQTKTLDADPNQNKVEFTNTQNQYKWLGGDNYKTNVFGTATTPSGGQEDE